MTETTPNPPCVQDPVADFLAKFVALLPGSPGDCPAPMQVAMAALGGGERAKAVLHGFGELLRLADRPWSQSATMLDEEQAVAAAAHRIVLPLQQVRLQAQADVIEAALAGRATCQVAGCGARMHSRGRESRTLQGRHGKLQLVLRRSVCIGEDCGRTVAVAARQLGIGTQRFTPACAEAVTHLATALPHGKAVSTLAQLLHIDVSEHAAQDLVQARGAALLALDQAAANDHDPYEPSGLQRESVGRPADSVPAADAREVAYLEIDGVLPMTRELNPETSHEVPGARGGKGRKYTLEGREVKNAVLYTAADHAQEMPSRGCLLRKTYVSYLGHWQAFALLVWLAMLRLRYDQSKLLVVLSDGAEWIRSLANWLPMKGRVVPILDFFHAAHRIWEVTRLIYGDDTDLCRARARMWCEVVQMGHVQMVIDELADWHDSRPAVQDKIDALVTYFNNNKDRMQYDEYTKRGLRITSGIVESANFHVTGARLKQQGMRWSEQGARELALLRADLCSDRWNVRTRQLLAA